MTSRQARTQRREAERKAAKLARKAERVETARMDEPAAKTRTEAFVSQTAALLPKSAFESQSAPCVCPDSGFVPQNPAAPPNNGFVSQNAPSPPKATPPSRDPIAPRRREINRANAQHSTGPRTSTGKLASSRNSLKHGLASGELILPGEDRAAFDALLNALLAEHQPANPTEELLIHEIAQAYWLTQRAIHLQNQCFTESGVDDHRLSLFLRYQITHDRRFHKALNTLIKLKKDRRGFVSQNRALRPQNNGFVSQSASAASAHPGFISQTAVAAAAPQPPFAPVKPLREDPCTGFVSQTGY